MEHILGLYERSYNPKEPIICVDEKSKQLLQDTRTRIIQKNGVTRSDYEYKRNGTQNIFVAVEPKGGFRKVSVTKKRKKKDFAQFIQDITHLKRYEYAKTIHIVLDNLNTHFAKSFYETFAKKEAEKVLKKVQFHYTPKHASWLNMAEIEIGIMDRQCTKGRMESQEKLKKNLRAWTKSRNKHKAKIHWRFTRENARKKFKYERYEGSREKRKD